MTSLVTARSATFTATDGVVNVDITALIDGASRDILFTASRSDTGDIATEIFVAIDGGILVPEPYVPYVPTEDDFLDSVGAPVVGEASLADARNDAQAKRRNLVRAELTKTDHHLFKSLEGVSGVPSSVKSERAAWRQFNDRKKAQINGAATVQAIRALYKDANGNGVSDLLDPTA